MSVRDVLRDLINRLSDEELQELYMLYKLSRENAGLVYEMYARHRRWRLGRYLREQMPPIVKRYEKAKIIKLPRPVLRRQVSVDDALLSRRSVRDFKDEPLSLEELSTLLYLSFGVTAWEHGVYGYDRFPLRAFPSAGALQPVEVYVFAFNVTGLSAGLYHYYPIDHVLEELKLGDFSDEVIDVALGQRHAALCPATIVMTAVWSRTRWKYGDRAYRYAMLDSGFAGENVYLACQALGLGTCAIGAFYDEDLCRLLEIDCRDEIPVLMFPVGKPA